MYDWANSVYSLVITTAIFPVYYQAVATNPDGSDVIYFFGIEVINSVLYAYALSFSFLFVAAILPILSGIADYSGRKKRFMKFFVYLGSLSCIGLYFFDGSNIEWGIICSVMASIGFSASLVFYDAFLPEIATPDRYDMVSAKGYSLGYIGSVLLLIVNIVVIENYEWFGFADVGLATRSAFLTVGVWWILFSQVTFYYLPENVFDRRPEGNIFLKGHEEILKILKRLKDLPVMKKYILAFFFYNTGVQTVLYLAATFGSKELEMDTGKLIMTILVIQLVAIFGAYIFAAVSNHRGNKFSLILMVIIWIFVCAFAYFLDSEVEFYILAFFVGLVMGGIQSLSRATFAKLIPSDSIEHASYFSFYDVTYNLSIVLGTFTYGFIEQVTHNMRYSALSLSGFFFIGLIILSITKLPGTIRPFK